jgi:hypothetical protein
MTKHADEQTASWPLDEGPSCSGCEEHTRKRLEVSRALTRARSERDDVRDDWEFLTEALREIAAVGRRRRWGATQKMIHIADTALLYASLEVTDL